MWTHYVDGEPQAWLEDEDIEASIQGPGETVYRHECKNPDDPEDEESDVCGYWWEDEDEEPDVCPHCWGTSEFIQTTESEAVSSWLNSAGVTIRGGEARVWMSVGDPRGAFVFTLRKRADGTLLLHTPYPGEGMPHMGLRTLHDGTFEVGAYNNEQKPPLYMADRLAEAVVNVIEDLDHYVGTHGPGPDRRRDALILALDAYHQARGE